MEKHGIIEKSMSDWSSPIILVKKNDGTLCFCVDFLRLNSVSKSDAYPMPRDDELLDRVGQAKFISTLDLIKGYWQVPMEESARPKTTFSTPFGLCQFRRMPFGLQGTPSTFQRMMDHILVGMQGFALAYLDNLIIHSDSWKEHVTYLQRGGRFDSETEEMSGCDVALLVPWSRSGGGAHVARTLQGQGCEAVPSANNQDCCENVPGINRIL